MRSWAPWTRYTPKHSKKQITLGSAARPRSTTCRSRSRTQLGHFKEQGLDVTINDFRGGAQSLQALAGGSVDVVTGAYEHPIRMQAKGRDVYSDRAWAIPGIVLGIAKSGRAPTSRRPI